MLMHGSDSLFLTRTQVTKIPVDFNNVFRKIFRISRHTSMRIINNFLGIKTLDCMYEEKLMCLIRNCGAFNIELIRLFQTLCKARSEIQPICYKFDLLAHMYVCIIICRIDLLCRDLAVKKNW